MHALELDDPPAHRGSSITQSSTCPKGQVGDPCADERPNKNEKVPLTPPQNDYPFDRLDVSEANGVEGGVDVGRDLTSELDDVEEPDLEGLQRLFTGPPARTKIQPPGVPPRGAQSPQLSGHFVPVEVCQYMLQAQAGAMEQAMGTLQQQMSEVMTKQAEAMERQAIAIGTALDRQLGLTQRVLEKLDRPAPELQAPTEVSLQDRAFALAIRVGEKFLGLDEPTVTEDEDE